MYTNLSSVSVNHNTEQLFGSRAVSRQFSSADGLLLKEELSNQILAALPASELARLSPFAEKVNLNGGEIVHQPGDAGKYVYFPETCVFSQFQILEDGRMCEIAMTGKEGLVGLPAILICQPDRYWTEVSVGGSAVRISAQVLEREFNENASLQARIIEFLTVYIGQISQRVICNCHHQIKERFCNWLLMLEERHGSNRFALTQEQIARFLGVHRPSLSCIAKELQEKDIISYSRGQLVLVNRRKLEYAACSCYREN